MPDILLCFKKLTKDPHKGSQESSGFQIPPKLVIPLKNGVKVSVQSSEQRLFCSVFPTVFLGQCAVCKTRLHFFGFLTETIREIPDLSLKSTGNSPPVAEPDERHEQ